MTSALSSSADIFQMYLLDLPNILHIVVKMYLLIVKCVFVDEICMRQMLRIFYFKKNNYFNVADARSK